MNDMAKNLVLWLVIAAVLLTVFNNFSADSDAGKLTYSDFVSEVQAGRVSKVTIDGFTIIGQRSNGERFETVRPAVQDPKLIDDLLQHNVVIEGKQPERQSIWTQLLVASFPILVIIAVFMFFMRQMQGACFFACSNISRTREAPTPTNISTKSEPEMLKKGTRASPAIALASSVLPVPGEPAIKTPRGI